jgi:prepilin-type N-terminal cleavage/methylation domain-containing protein
MQNKKGFTLMEILLVVAAISILAGIVIVAINPTKQLGETRNAQRRADVNTILNAVYQYAVDNNGNLPGPGTISTTATEICRTGVAAATCTTDGLINLSDLTTNEKYVVSIPYDPTTGTTNSTKYLISRTANNRVTVSATGEQGATISVTR